MGFRGDVCGVGVLPDKRPDAQSHRLAERVDTIACVPRCRWASRRAENLSRRAGVEISVATTGRLKALRLRASRTPGDRVESTTRNDARDRPISWRAFRFAFGSCRASVALPQWVTQAAQQRNAASSKCRPRSRAPAVLAAPLRTNAPSTSGRLNVVAVNSSTVAMRPPYGGAWPMPCLWISCRSAACAERAASRTPPTTSGRLGASQPRQGVGGMDYFGVAVADGRRSSGSAGSGYLLDLSPGSGVTFWFVS